jgi:hypothetical protein
VEVLIRRLNGVHLADSTGNWGVCSALQWTGPNNTLIPRSTLTNALKQAAQMEKLTHQTSRFGINNNQKFGKNFKAKSSFQSAGKLSSSGTTGPSAGSGASTK